MRTLPIVSVILVSAALLPAQQPAERTFATPPTFATPKEAAQALIDAAARSDTSALLKIFGSQGRDLVESGDPAEDKTSRAEFVRRAHEKLTIELDPSQSRATVVVGNDKWPLPVPLVKTKSGQWHFNPARGRTEILARRIGQNELIAIDTCRGYVEAQMDYSSRDSDKDGILEYAQRIVGTPGKNDGLFEPGASTNAVPKSFADAASTFAAAQKRTPYHGYYYRILTAQGPDAPGGAHSYIVKGEMIGGFALIAWPAEYGVSGIKTFLVNNRGVVYERDLGPTTASLARQTTAFDPDKKWQAVDGE